ncbi:MAG: hypothetical protein HY905_17525 [Deltaproteobacteria bacterium]|nr:hypothetical protein [Deltaproteobacteria bacterium]
MHHTSRARTVAIVAVLVPVFACNSGGGSVPGDLVSISGTVLTLDSGGAAGALPAFGVTVTVSADFDGSGSIEPSERVSGVTDAAGGYTLTTPARTGQRLVVRFALEGYAPALKTVDVGSLADVRLDAALAQMSPLTCQESGCRDDAGEVLISGVTIGSGYAQVFNPVTDGDKFPGGFDDDQGNLLVSAVFAAFDLYDAAGRPLDDLGGGTATVRLKTPRDAWSVITDIQPGNGRVDVPMYAFDETTGEWTAEGTGWLENGTGEAVGEDVLASIRDGSFGDVLFSVFEAGHFSYWNVDWPIGTHTVVRGVVVDGDGNPVEGATVGLQGLSYSGSSTPQTTGGGGSFCLDAMRSEGPGEDVDNDGVTGETQRVLITVVSDGKGYRIAPVDLPSDHATCPTGGVDVGNVELKPENEIQVQLCHLTGTVRLDGAPVEGVTVNAQDEYLDPEISIAACTYPDCTSFGQSDASGAFDFTGVFASLLKVSAVYGTTDGSVSFFYNGDRQYYECPTAPVAIDLYMLACYGNLLATSYASGEISWSPAVPVSLLSVTGAAGNPKWYVYSAGGFAPPVTYGVLPEGAMQVFPASGGRPQPVVSGDAIQPSPINDLVPYGGAMCFSFGSYTVP